MTHIATPIGELRSFSSGSYEDQKKHLNTMSELLENIKQLPREEADAICFLTSTILSSPLVQQAIFMTDCTHPEQLTGVKALFNIACRDNEHARDITRALISKMTTALLGNQLAHKIAEKAPGN